MTDEKDPTGVSHLLAGLKETRPMPPDLAERIQASLEGEQLARESAAAEGEADDEAPAESSASPGFWNEMDSEDATPRRRSSRAGRWVLGLAAAAVLVMGVGGIFAIRAGDSPDGAADAPAASQERADGSQQSTTSAARDEGGSVPAFAVTQSDTDYTQDALPSQAREIMKDPDSAEQLTDDSMLGSLSTAAGAKDCLGRLGNSELQPVVVDVAEFEGEPGVLLIAEPVPEGSPKAWAITTGCEEIWPGPADLED